MEDIVRHDFKQRLEHIASELSEILDSEELDECDADAIETAIININNAAGSL